MRALVMMFRSTRCLPYIRFNLRIHDTAVNSQPGRLVVGCPTPSSGWRRRALAACVEDRSKPPSLTIRRQDLP